MSRRGWALFVAMCLIWGIPYLLIRISVAEISPAVLVFTRTAIGALILMPFVLARGITRDGGDGVLGVFPAVVQVTDQHHPRP